MSGVLSLFSLQGRTAIVTGATRGIGQSLAIALAEAGADIVLIQRDSSNVATKEQIEKLGRKAIIYEADLADNAQISGLIKRIVSDGHDLSILVNCGGIQRRHPPHEFPDNDWNEVLQVNLNAVFTLCRDAGAHMLTRDGPHRGSIINIASLVSFQGGLNVPAYAAAKGGVAQLTKALSNSWASRGINVNAIAPGYIHTDMNDALIKDEKRAASILERIPAGRWGLPEDFAGSAVPSTTKLEAGIYVPTVAFFKDDEEVDVETTRRHVLKLASSGIKGIVTHGSNGEAAHLSHDERILITKTTKQALDESGQDVRLIVGCGAQSTREAIKLCKDAASAGGDAALVLPPSYFASLLSSKLLLDHFRKVADASPIPILIYNFPAVQSGLDITSDQLIELSKHPKIVGVKLTCGNTGKLARVVAVTKGSDFLTFGGSSDFLLQTLSVGGAGVIAGLGNIAPTTNVRTMLAYEAGEMDKAREMQEILAEADWVAIKGGFVAVKVGLNEYNGYGGQPRSPCAMPEKSAQSGIINGFARLIDLEHSLQKA
ncbi:dihydrodipicolinate synthetase family protein [Aureobasidium subglaciale]|nr:dihydrodipicolinate synthetase family protein [Aureobasidium subglaciale]